MIGSRGRVGLAIAVIMAIAGCASTEAYRPDPARPYDPGYFQLVRVDLSDQEIVSMLGNHYAGWEGVPHRLGGESRSGVDCLGFARLTYRELFGLTLPRTTGDMVRMGVEISRRAIRPGDLVFFRPPGWNHVGIALDGRRFVHASASRGVIISHIDEAYWREHYWISRRVMRSTN